MCACTREFSSPVHTKLIQKHLTTNEFSMSMEITDQHKLTNNMSSEIVLKLNVVGLLPPIFIHKYSFEVVSKKFCICGQVKLEISKVGGKKAENLTLILSGKKYMFVFSTTEYGKLSLLFFNMLYVTRCNLDWDWTITLYALQL